MHIIITNPYIKANKLANHQDLNFNRNQIDEIGKGASSYSNTYETSLKLDQFHQLAQKSK